LHVFRAEDSPGGEEDLGWGRFADEVRLNPVAGDHYSVFGTHCQALPTWSDWRSPRRRP